MDDSHRLGHKLTMRHLKKQNTVRKQTSDGDSAKKDKSVFCNKEILFFIYEHEKIKERKRQSP